MLTIGQQIRDSPGTKSIRDTVDYATPAPQEPG